MAKRPFIIDTGKERVETEGYTPQNVALKYLMKRRRSLLSTKDKEKVERLFSELPISLSVIGKKVTKNYRVRWERVSTGEFAGARFTFTLEEAL